MSLWCLTQTLYTDIAIPQVSPKSHRIPLEPCWETHLETNTWFAASLIRELQIRLNWTCDLIPGSASLSIQMFIIEEMSSLGSPFFFHFALSLVSALWHTSYYSLWPLYDLFIASNKQVPYVTSSHYHVYSYNSPFTASKHYIFHHYTPTNASVNTLTTTCTPFAYEWIIIYTLVAAVGSLSGMCKRLIWLFHWAFETSKCFLERTFDIISLDYFKKDDGEG